MYADVCVCVLVSNSVNYHPFYVFSECRYEHITQNVEHFWRLKQILHKDVLEKLRECFKSEFQAKYNLVWEDNSTSGNFFLMKIPHTKKPDQPITFTVSQGNTEEFNGDALYYCLLDCGTDLLESETRTNVEKLRAQSKALDDATSTNLPDKDFRARLQEIQDVYRTLQWDQSQLCEVTQRPLSRDDKYMLTKEKLGKSVTSMSFSRSNGLILIWCY